jgi:hypothetical protein
MVRAPKSMDSLHITEKEVGCESAESRFKLDITRWEILGLNGGGFLDRSFGRGYPEYGSHRLRAQTPRANAWKPLNFFSVKCAS